MIDTSSQNLVGLNQQTYLRLKLALSLSLRRQIFIAVCDDLPLRDRLASRLQQDLIQTASLQSDRTSAEPDVPEYPRLVTLKLDLHSPNPVVQIAQWLSFNPPPRSGKRRYPVPAFQFLGIEHLTRQPATVQQQFLTHLQGIERSLPVLDSSLLFWMPRPWFRTLPQSAQEFWRCRTAIFEFIGEPRPLAVEEDEIHHLVEPSLLHIEPDIVSEVADSDVTAIEPDRELRTDIEPDSSSEIKSDREPEVKSDVPSDGSSGIETGTYPDLAESAGLPEEEPPLPPPSQLSNLWPMLQADLAQFDQREEPQASEHLSVDSSMTVPPGRREPNSSTVLVTAAPLKIVALAGAHSSQTAPAAHAPQKPPPSSPKNGRTGPVILPPPPVLSPKPIDVQQPHPAVAVAIKEKPEEAHTKTLLEEPATHLSKAVAQPNGHRKEELLEFKATFQDEVLHAEVADSDLDLEAEENPFPPFDPNPQEARLISPLLTLNAPELETEADRQIALFQEYIEQLLRQNASPALLAETYRTLGDIYRDRIDQEGPTPENLQGGIQAYEQVLIWLSETSPLWPDVLNDLGNLHWMLSRQVGEPNAAESHLQQAIQSYELGLARLDDQLPQNLAMIQNNLGAAYTDLARYQEPGANLQRSVQCYQKVLEYRTPQRDPGRYAATQNNLGTAYWNLAQQERPRHYLKEAIAAYGEALEYCTSEDDPTSFGMIHNNLGTAYWNLAQFEQPQHWLQRAIESYQIALKYRTPEASLLAHAATQNNLGTAYWHLASQLEEAPQRLDCWQKAIDAYDMALHAVGQLPGRSNLSFDLYASYANLGLAHYQMATDTQLRVAPEACGRHLELALNHHVAALQGWQQKPQLRQTALGHIIKTMRALYRRSGLSGQNVALSMVPADLLPEILPRL